MRHCLPQIGVLCPIKLQENEVFFVVLILLLISEDKSHCLGMSTLLKRTKSY